MKIKRRHLQRLIESLLIENEDPIWSYSEDSDFPAHYLKKNRNKPTGEKLPIYDKLNSSRVVLLTSSDTYTRKGNTHGGESHALKHLAEFDPVRVALYMSAVINKLTSEVAAGKMGDSNGQFNTLILIDPKTGATKPGPKVGISDITAGDMLNTVDQIYDEALNLAADQVTANNPFNLKVDAPVPTAGSLSITDPFSNYVMSLIDEMNREYDRHVREITDDDSVDMSDHNLEAMGIYDEQDLMNWFGQTPRKINFMASFKGGPLSRMYLRTKDTAYVGTREGLITTLMHLHKKPPGSWNQIIGRYHNGSTTQIDPNKYSIFRRLCDQIKKADPSLNIPPLP